MIDLIEFVGIEERQIVADIDHAEALADELADKANWDEWVEMVGL